MSSQGPEWGSHVGVSGVYSLKQSCTIHDGIDLW